MIGPIPFAPTTDDDIILDEELWLERAPSPSELLRGKRRKSEPSSRASSPVSEGPRKGAQLNPLFVIRYPR